ncbi:MAG TPA: GldG family protein [Verrucomicrobiae bacterium]
MSNPRPSFSPASRWKIGFDMLLRTVLVLAVMVMLNYLGAQFFHRFYLSSQTRVALSSRTLAVLSTLTNHVAVTLYYDTRDQENFYPNILALLNEYHAVNKNISVHTVDYVRDAGAAEKLKVQYNLPAATDSPNSPPAKDLVIFDSNGRVIVIPGEAIVSHKLEPTAKDDPKQKELQFRNRPVAFNGEIMFTSKLLALASASPFKAYFLQGHGESSLTDSGQFGFAKFGLELAQNYIAVTNLELTANQPVPMDCNLLIIAAPTTLLPDADLQKIDKYLAEGGRLLVLFNYASIDRPTGLEPILQHWGVNVLADYIKDPQNSITGQDVKIREFNPQSFVAPLTQLSLQMILPRPIEKVKWQNPPANAPLVKELALSSETATLAGDPTAAPRRYPVLAAIEQKPVAGVVTPRGNTRIVVAGDSIFLGNYYIEGGANRDFLNYAANWLLDRQELLAGISPQPVKEFRLMLTQKQSQQLDWLLLGALPGGVLFLGWLVWLVRRK